MTGSSKGAEVGPSAQAGPGSVSQGVTGSVLGSSSRVNMSSHLSLFTEPSEPLPEEPKLEGMARHHCHKNAQAQSGLSPERLRARRQLYAACAVCLIFMAGEVVGKLGGGHPSSPYSVLPRPSKQGKRRAGRD